MKLSVRSLATSLPRKDIAKAEAALKGFLKIRNDTLHIVHTQLFTVRLPLVATKNQDEPAKREFQFLTDLHELADLNEKPKFKLLLSSITSTEVYAKGLQILKTRFYILRLYILKRITFEDITTEMSKVFRAH